MLSRSSRRKYRVPLWLHYVEGMPAADLAAALGKTARGVRYQLSRGVEELRKVMAHAGYLALAAPGLEALLESSAKEHASNSLRLQLMELPGKLQVVPPPSHSLPRRRLRRFPSQHPSPILAVACLAAGGVLIGALALATGKKEVKEAPQVLAAKSAMPPPTPPTAPLPSKWTVNFGPEGLALPAGVLSDSGEPYDAKRGYGWVGPKRGPPIPGAIAMLQNGPAQIYVGREVARRNLSSDITRDTMLAAGWRGHTETWMIDVPNGKYHVTVCVGDPSCDQGPHKVVVQGKTVIKNVMTQINEFYLGEETVDVQDGRLTMMVGAPDGTATDGAQSSDTILNYLVIKRIGN